MQQLLQQGAVAKQQVHDTVQDYASHAGVDGPLDGSIHPALQTNQSPDSAIVVAQRQQDGCAGDTTEQPER